MVKKSDLIREMLEDGMTPKEIAEELDVPVQTVYNIRYRDKLRKRKEEVEDDLQTISRNTDSENRRDIDTAGFSRKTRFPKEQEESTGEEDYECGACGHRWKAPQDEYQDSCPVCGVEFE